MEVLRAELASAFVGSELALPTDIPEHARYMATWVKTLKEDNREIFWAAADAQKIADMQLGFHPDDFAEAVPEANGNGPLASAVREQLNPFHGQLPASPSQA